MTLRMRAAVSWVTEGEPLDDARDRGRGNPGEFGNFAHAYWHRNPSAIPPEVALGQVECMPLVAS